MNSPIEIIQRNNQSLRLEFYLTSPFETSFNISENGASVFNANIDTNNHGFYDCGTNTSGFDKKWLLEVKHKVKRGGDFQWSQDNMVAQPSPDNIHYQIFSFITTQNNIQNATINVTLQ